MEAQYGGDDALSNGTGTVVGEDIMNGLSAGITSDPYPDYYTITGANTTRIFTYFNGRFRQQWPGWLAYRPQ